MDMQKTLTTPRELITNGYALLNSLTEADTVITGIVLPMPIGKKQIRCRLQISIHDRSDLDLAKDCLLSQPEAAAKGAYQVRCTIYLASEDKLIDCGARGLDAVCAALLAFEESEISVKWDEV